MAISKKGKRKIVTSGVTYYWYVEPDFDPYTGHSLLVTIISEDKQFLIKYYIAQCKDNFFLTVLGSKFSEGTNTGGVYKRFMCPKFGEEGIFTPKDVVKLIEWCLNPNAEKIEVDYLGKKLNNT